MARQARTVEELNAALNRIGAEYAWAVDSDPVMGPPSIGGVESSILHVRVLTSFLLPTAGARDTDVHPDDFGDVGWVRDGRAEKARERLEAWRQQAGYGLVHLTWKSVLEGGGWPVEAMVRECGVLLESWADAAEVARPDLDFSLVRAALGHVLRPRDTTS